MTKLSAINRILRSLNEYPFAALDTGGTSRMAQAETIFDEYDKTIQAEGWHANKEFNVTLETADTTKLAMVIAGDGVWTVATKTLTATGDFSSYTWASGDHISVTGGTGVTAAWYEIASKTSDDAIVLKEEIADSNNTDTVTDIIGWEDALVAGSDILRMDNYRDTRDVVLRTNAAGNAMLYDRRNNTFSFGDSMLVTLVRQLDFTALSEKLQLLIIAEAAIEFQNFLVKGIEMDKVLRAAAVGARTEARREEQEVAQVNVLDTLHAAQIQGQTYVGYRTRR